MSQMESRGRRRRPEVPGVIEICDGRLKLRCWPDGHWVGEVRRRALLSVLDRRCEKYVVFSISEILEKLKSLN